MAGAGKKTFTAGETLTASDVNTYLMEQSVMVFGGTAARSSAIPTPSEGMFAVTTDNDELDYYDGSNWVSALPVGAWTSYTPTFSGFTLGNGTIDFKYVKLGKIVHVRGTITLGSTSSVAGPVDIGVPVTAAYAAIGFPLGHVSFWNGSTVFNGVYISVGSTSNGRATVYLANSTHTSSADVTSTAPFTWTTGNQLFLNYTYEAA